MYNKIGLARYLDMIAAPTATPGGGSVSAYAGALSAALGSMASGIALKKVKAHSSDYRSIKSAQNAFRRNQSAMLKLAEADSAAYDKVSRAYKIPRHILTRREAINRALKKAAEVPYHAMSLSLDTLKEISRIRKLMPVQILSDINVAILLGKASYNGARMNVIVNMESLTDKRMARQIEKDIEGIERKFTEVILWLDDWI